jgi:hypothetical protein
MEFLLLLLILVVLIFIAARSRRGPSGLFIRQHDMQFP